jgi:hypothetical protein
VEQGAVRGALSLLRRTVPLLVGVFGWGQGTQAAMWPELVVILAPGFDQAAGSASPKKKCSFKHSSRSLLLKTFDEGVLHRLAGFDVVPGHPLGGPAQHRVAGQFGPVVHQEAVMADD